MSKLIVFYGDNPECVEGFSASCKRSVQGALHLRPRKNITVTDDEFNHLMARKDLAPKIKKLAEKPDSDAEAPAVQPAVVQAKEADTAAPVAAPEAEKSSQPAAEDAGGKRNSNRKF